MNAAPITTDAEMKLKLFDKLKRVDEHFSILEAHTVFNHNNPNCFDVDLEKMVRLVKVMDLMNSVYKLGNQVETVVHMRSSDLMWSKDVPLISTLVLRTTDKLGCNTHHIGIGGSLVLTQIVDACCIKQTIDGNVFINSNLVNAIYDCNQKYIEYCESERVSESITSMQLLIFKHKKLN